MMALITRRPNRRTVVAGTAIAIVAVLALFGSAGAHRAVGIRTSVGVGIRAAGTKAYAAKGTKPYAARVSYDETSHGHAVGQTTVGILGHGAFSAKLGAGAALKAALIALATGVPVTRIAQGGTYVVSRNINAAGDSTGIVVAKLKAHGLGTLCVSYSETLGHYVPGSAFVPQSGTFKTIGGTGRASRWRLRIGFRQTSVSGNRIEQFGVNGSEQASIGRPRALTGACRKVAARAKH